MTPSRSPRHDAPRTSVARRRGAPILALLALAALTGCSTEESGPRPNIVLISIDTMRAEFLGCYGRGRNVSPAIDAFAAEGVVFEDVTAASPWTMPSHASMLTGMYPSTHGVKDHQYALTNETLATWLQKAGYQTMCVVNSHNIGFPDYGLMRGYDDGKGLWEFEMNILPDGKTPGDKILNSATRIIRRATKLLDERDPARPFFLFMHFYDVHTDFTPDPKWELEYVAPYEGRITGNTQDLLRARGQKWELDDADVRYLEEMYDAEIRTFDEKLRTFFDYLDVNGLADSTVVAITSDHGEEYYEHGSLLHGRTYYQELMGIPLIVRGPGVPVKRVEEPVHLIDVAPMLYSLAGVPAPPGMDGIDISKAWRDPDALPDVRFLFSEADHNNKVDGKDVSDIRAMVRLQDTKLLYDKITGKKELYDIAADPREQNDLSASDPERVELLWSQLEKFMSREGSATEIGPSSEDTTDLLRKLGYVDDESE